MFNVLAVSRHPRTSGGSAANKTILEELTVLLPGTETGHPGDLYPEYTFDVEAKQEKLRAADVIMLQYPLWRYGQPMLLQKWMEGVFVRGFSHEPSDATLRGKRPAVSITTEALQAHYAPDSVDFNDLPMPAKATCALMGIESMGSLPLYGISCANCTDEAAYVGMVERSCEHAKHLAEPVSSL